jgi:PAS domain S-box-containing protein
VSQSSAPEGAALEELARLRERMDLLSSASFEGLVFHVDGVVFDVNQRLLELTGYAREEILGVKLLELCVAPEDLPEVQRRMARGIEGEYVITGVRRDGSRYRAELQSKQGKLGDRPVRVVAVRDVTEREHTQALLCESEQERRELERAFERSQRLDGLGVLAGGIAHDFNNLLTVVLGNAELLRTKLAGPHERALAQSILDAGERAAGLTAQMLAYAGKSELGPRTPVDLGLLVEQLRALLDATLSKKAQVSLFVAPGKVVLGNRTTLTQLLMNMLTNASDSLQQERGTISVRISNLEQPDARFSRALGARVGPGQWLLLEVSDTGMGMDEATQARIFEPFFTTKAQGHGLGLAACIGIVSSHGGAILVESELGRGSTFSVLLPAYPGEAKAEPAPERHAHVAARRLLIVDDELLVRTHLRLALERQGYQIEEAATGHAALEALARDAPSAVLLDVTMPDLSGIEVLRRMREQGSRVPVILSSGYHAAALDAERDSFQAFLAKPYTLSELFEAVESALIS